MDEHDISKLVEGLRGVLADMADEHSNGVWAWSALCDITDDLDDRVGLLKKGYFKEYLHGKLECSFQSKLSQ